MYELTKNLRTHIAVLKDWSELHLTDDQYSTIRLAKDDRKPSEFITIKCPDTWYTEYDWELWNIKEFRHKQVSNSKYKVICDYWNRHDLINWEFNCDCFQKYWFSSIDLKTWAKNNNKSLYMQDLTEDDKRACWAFLNNKIINKNE